MTLQWKLTGTVGHGASRSRGAVGAALLPLAAAASLALAGCQSGPIGGRISTWRVEPVVDQRDAQMSAPQLYTLGRYYEGQLRTAPAIDAFRQSLAKDPGYSESYNALGVLYCEQGRVDDGIAAFEQALRLQPSAAHVQSNLGYALLLAGRYPEAVTALQRAVALDGGNARARSNLALALSQVGLGQDVEIATAAEPRPWVREVVPGAYDLLLADTGADPMRHQIAADAMRKPSPADAMPQTVPAEVPAPTATAPQRTFRLEISNGNGMPGAARQLGEWLARSGAPAARLTNERPYNRVNTVVYFNRGFEAQARRLQGMLGAQSGTLVPDTLVRADVRISVGRDMVPVLVAGRDVARAARRVAG